MIGSCMRSLTIPDLVYFYCMLHAQRIKSKLDFHTSCHSRWAALRIRVHGPRGSAERRSLLSSTSSVRRRISIFRSRSCSKNKSRAASRAPGKRGARLKSCPNLLLKQTDAENRDHDEHYEDDARHSLLFENPLAYISENKSNSTNRWKTADLHGSERMMGCKMKQKRYTVSCSSIGMCQEKRLEWALKHPESSAFRKARTNFNSQHKEDEHGNGDRCRLLRLNE